MKRRLRIYPLFLPFAGCPHRCSFCNQWASSGVSPERWRKALEEGLSFIENSRNRYDEVAVYGGTPVLSDLGWDVLHRLHSFAKSGKIGGIRISTRPDSITPDIARKLAALGVTTVEIGVQSLSDDVLSRINRGHTVSDAEKAVVALKDAGISVVAQFMVGLPGEGEEVWQIPGWCQRFGVDAVRLFPLVVLRGTEIEEWWREGKYRPLDVSEAVKILVPIVVDLEGRGIPVIQIGLHPSDELKKAVLAGPYVENLGEIVRSVIAYCDVLRGKRCEEDVPVSQRVIWRKYANVLGGVCGGHSGKLEEGIHKTDNQTPDGG